MNITINNSSVNFYNGRNNGHNFITPETTLAELIAALGNVTKAEKTPTSKVLRETAGEPITKAEDGSVLVYANGYCMYDNGSGRTVMWLPSCTSFTYHFDPLGDKEKEYLRETAEIPEGMLEILPWIMAVTLIGEHRIEANSMNRTGSRTGTKDYDSDDNGDKDGDAEEAMEKSYEKAYVWREDRIGESPETVLIRKETRREMLESMTDKQREVFTLYYYEGFNQRQISEMLGISRDSVNDRLEGALRRAKKIFS